ncbi:membrane protein [Psychrobacter glaciei]|uniref:Membrane protein n=1 Tax=Psychrobacter glaciei TaxID=619771 RepID=A0ABQ3GNH6_9GAMM|nr:cell envelope integrity protein CreD [Psychrobacter glaciei]GHD28389.1 membrane protein [Psychrobacter glaciei]
MQKTLFTKLSIIAGLCIIFAIGLNMIGSVIYERQNYAASVIKEIAQQHINPQEVITPFIAIPTTVTPECQITAPGTTSKCAPSYSKIETIFANQTQATQDLEVSTDTYKRGIYHATSYDGALTFDQRYIFDKAISRLYEATSPASAEQSSVNTPTSNNKTKPKETIIHWNEAKLIIPVSDLRGVATLPTVTIEQKPIKATYPQTPLLKNLTYVEVAIPQNILQRATKNMASQQSKSRLIATSTNSEALASTDIGSQSPDIKDNQATDIMIDLPLAGISNLNTVPTGQNFNLTMRSNWHAPNFIGKALPNAKKFTANGFEASWQNQYLTIANNQYLSQCLSTANNRCVVISKATLDTSSQSMTPDDAITAIEGIVTEEGTTVTDSYQNVRLNSFGVSFAEPNDVYLQTERAMKYALLLILVSFGTFFLFEVIKSSRIHPIQYLLVGCALFVFYVLLLPLAEQIVFWKAYTIAASACVGLIGWYTYYVLGGIKRAAIFTATLAGLYASFFGILTTEDMNLLLGAVFCFVLLACVMVMTRKIDWYKIA